MHAAFCAAAIVGVTLVAGCGSAGVGASPVRGDLTLEQARAFEEFPLVYAGERVDGLPLVAILRRADTADYVSFVYGDCHPSSEGGCAPPVEIQVWPANRRSLDAYDSSVPGAPVPEPATIRGRPAAFFDGGTRLEIYTGPSTVVVFSDSPGRLGEVAAALRCVGGAAPGAPTETLAC